MHRTPTRYPALEQLALAAAVEAEAQRDLALNVLSDLARTHRPPTPRVRAAVREALSRPVICDGVRSGRMEDCRCGRGAVAR